MFPKDDSSTIDTLTKNQNTGLKRSFLFDFSTKQFIVKDGKVDEIEYKNGVLQWVKTFLSTTLNKHAIYDGTDFGITVKQFIGLKKSNLGLIRSELERQITENITINPAITGISDFECENDGDLLNVKFTVILKDLEELEVDMNV